MLRPFLVYLPSPKGIIIKPKQTKVHFSDLPTYMQKAMNCSCGHTVHVSQIQVYLYEDVFQRERVFHLDRSQWLSQINSAHLHWNLQKISNTVIYFRTSGSGTRCQKKVNSRSFNVIAVFLQLFQFVKCRRTFLVEESIFSHSYSHIKEDRQS